MGGSFAIWKERDSNVPHRHPDQVGKDFHSPARTCRALVVHHEVENLSPIIHIDRFAVLSSHIHNGPDFGTIHEVRSPGMAGDLSNRLLGHGHVDATVTGSDTVVDVLDFHIGLFQGVTHAFSRAVRAI